MFFADKEEESDEDQSILFILDYIIKFIEIW